MTPAEPEPAVSTPKRRWYQYSLRTLLGLVLVCCLALGWWRWNAFGVPDQFSVIKNELCENARRAYETTMDSYSAGFSTENDVYRWSKAWMEAERAVSKARDQEIAAVRAHIERTRKLCKRVNSRERIARVSYWLTEAELLLAQIDSGERPRCVQAIYDRRQLQGVWKTQSQTLGGKPVAQWEFDTISVEDRLADVTSKSGGSFGMLTLDPVSTPKTFEIYGFNEDYTFECAGTYQLAGDIWALALANNAVIVLEKQKMASSTK